MKSLNSLTQYALSTFFVFFIFLMMAEAQTLANYSQLQREDGMILQRLTHDESAIRQCVMNFHSDVVDENDPNSESFDYVYLRATEDDTKSNHLILTEDGMMIIADLENCTRVAQTRASADSAENTDPDLVGTGIDIKLYVKGQIAVEGGLGTNTVVSDQRFKKNIKPLKNSLDIIRNTNFVEYQYNSASGISSEKAYYGVLAQEMEKVLPSTVMKAERRIRTNEKRSTEFYMFNPNDLIYSGLNAIKELDEENQLLNVKLEQEITKNEALEQRVSELEKVLKALINEDKTGVINSNGFSSAQLYQNIPNPLNQSTDIQYYLPDNAKNAFIIIQDINGKIITQFDLPNSGIGKINFNTKQYGISPGTYTYSMIVDGLPLTTKKMLLVE